MKTTTLPPAKPNDLITVSPVAGAPELWRCADASRPVRHLYVGRGITGRRGCVCGAEYIRVA
jgi:hypothetical protein